MGERIGHRIGEAHFIRVGIVINLLDVDVAGLVLRLFLRLRLHGEGFFFSFGGFDVLFEDGEAFLAGEEIDGHDDEFDDEGQNPVHRD